MTEFEYLRPDIPDMLSARSYLELGGPHSQLSQQSQQLQQPQHPNDAEIPESLPAMEKPDINSSPKGKSGPRPAKPSNSEKAVTVGHPRKRGRPRLETTKDAAAIEERRLQIRRAQRTYRQKKEATIQALKTRVDALEQTLQNVSDLMTSESELEPRNSLGQPIGSWSAIAHSRQLVLAEIERVRPSGDAGYDPDDTQGQTPHTLRDIFGYNVSHSNHNTEDGAIKNHPQEHADYYPHPRSPSPLINRLFPTTTIYTYSYQESDLSRRLQRFCLEHTYRWLSDPRSDPGMMSRVFGLIPCIHDMPGIRRNYRRIMQSEIGSPLEVVEKLPFYKLGGAGTHYPRIGTDGQPIYPDRLRRPGRILRRMTRILQRGGIQDWDEDWSGDVEPLAGEVGENGIWTMTDADRLRALDLDGEWYDCHDIQGYLEDQGVAMDGSSMWMEVSTSKVKALYGFSPEHSASQYYVSPAEMSGIHPSTPCRYVLDVESFFELLLANLRILGRAPGFRAMDVDAALRTTIHRRPLS